MHATMASDTGIDFLRTHFKTLLHPPTDKRIKF